MKGQVSISLNDYNLLIIQRDELLKIKSNKTDGLFVKYEKGYPTVDYMGKDEAIELLVKDRKILENKIDKIINRSFIDRLFNKL